MKALRGSSHTTTLTIVILIAVATGISYIWMQRSGQQSDHNLPNQSNRDQIDPQVQESWTEYRFEQYGLAFKYPRDWNIEITTTAGHEDRPNILIKDSQGQLVTGIYGYIKNIDDCAVFAYDADPQPGISIGGYRTTVMKTCANLENWIGAGVKDGQSVAITTGFVGKPTESDARKLLESLSGIVSLPIIN